jgi:hypothetical protein
VNRRHQLAIERAACPLAIEGERGCGQPKGAPCVYLGPPDHMRTWPSQRHAVEREGTPMATTVHAARSRVLHNIERTAERRARARRPLSAPTTRAVIAAAERQHDQREAAQLVGWLRAGGAALLLSVVELPRVLDVEREVPQLECPECDAPVELLHSGVRCTSCAWWHCR